MRDDQRYVRYKRFTRRKIRGIRGVGRGKHTPLEGLVLLPLVEIGVLLPFFTSWWGWVV
jgi:hypothetical protein